VCGCERHSISLEEEEEEDEDEDEERRGVQSKIFRGTP